MHNHITGRTPLIGIIGDDDSGTLWEAVLCADCEGTGCVHCCPHIVPVYQHCSQCEDEHQPCPACEGLGYRDREVVK